MTAVWRCAKCDRTQGEDIEKPCECGSTIWVSISLPRPEGIEAAVTVRSEFDKWTAPAPRTAYTIGADPAVSCDGDGFHRWERTATGWNLFRSVDNGPWVFDRHIERERHAPEQCKTCDGAGYREGLTDVLNDDRGTVQSWEREGCQDCDGTGFEPEQPTALDYCPKPNTP